VIESGVDLPDAGDRPDRTSGDPLTTPGARSRPRRPQDSIRGPSGHSRWAEDGPSSGCLRGQPRGRSADSRPPCAATSTRHDADPSGWPRRTIRSRDSSSGPNSRLTRAVQSRGRPIGQGVKAGRSVAPRARCNDRLPHLQSSAHATGPASSTFRSVWRQADRKYSSDCIGKDMYRRR
jgi:hypothetical protein